jgi:hypothetical protein
MKAYDSGRRQNQFIVASGLLFFLMQALDPSL